MADLVRIGGQWKPTDLVTAQNLVSSLSDQVQHHTRLYNNAKTEKGRTNELTRLDVLNSQLASASQQYEQIKAYFKSPTGVMDAYSNYSRLTSVVHGELKLPGIAPIGNRNLTSQQVADNVSANPVANIGLNAGGAGLGLLLLFLASRL